MANKNKEDKLHKLIQSLSKSEKRYFKLFSQKGGTPKDKNYLKLFDVLERSKVYNEVSLIQQLKSLELNTDYLSGDKNYLLELILESQRMYHADSSKRLKVLKYLTDIEILFEKDLIFLALNRLKKVKKICTKEDLLSYLPEILRWERKLIGQVTKMSIIDDQYGEYQEAIKKLANFNEFDFLYRRSTLIRLNVSKARSNSTLQEYDVIINHPLMKAKETFSFSANFRYLQTLAIYYYSKDDLQEEYNCNNQLLVLMNETPNFKKDHPYDYITIYSRVLILSKKVAPDEYFSILTDYLKFAESTKKDKRKVKAQGYSLAYSTELVRMINEGLYEDGATLSIKVINCMKTYGDIISPAVKINNYYKFAYIYIGLEEYSKALDHINTILNNFDEKYRPDIYRYAKILVLLIHMELGNLQILPYITQSAILHFKNRKKYFNSEKLLLQFFKKVYLAKNTNTLDQLILETYQSFNEILKDSKERYILSYFDFKTWFESKIENKKLIELKQKKKP